jgi:hypothetical protein
MNRIWQFCTAWPRGFIGWLHTAVCALTTEDGRKGWAMLAALGCCIIDDGHRRLCAVAGPP